MVIMIVFKSFRITGVRQMHPKYHYQILDHFIPRGFLMRFQTIDTFYTIQILTVKPVYKNHPWDQQNRLITYTQLGVVNAFLPFFHKCYRKH